MNDKQNIKKLFITGTVGVGKTTLIKKVIAPYISEIGGFYTEEINDQNGRRNGFKLVGLNGTEGIMAEKGLKSPHRLGKYGVNVSVIDTVGIKAVADALEQKKMVVIDEIGTMEIMSQKFLQVLLQCFVTDICILATLRFKSQPFNNDIERLENKKILHLTRENTHDVREYIERWIAQCLKK